MKRAIVLALLILAGLCSEISTLDSHARSYRGPFYSNRYAYRSRSYYDYRPYYYPTFGITSPYTRGHRPLNVPVSNRSYRAPRPVVYVVQQPVPIPPAPQVTLPVSSAYSYPRSPIRVYGPTQPTIIERIIIERQPQQDQSNQPPPPPQPLSYIPSTPVGDEGSFVRQLDLAQRQFRERRYQDAVETFHRASGFKPGNATGKMGQALALLAVGDYEGSASALRRALILHPAWNEHPVLLATFYGDVNDFNAHLARVERYVKKNPDNIEARFVLAYALFIADRLDEAADHLAMILENNPGDLEATTLLGKLASVAKTKQP